MIRRYDDLIDRGADEPKYGAVTLARVLDCQVQTVRRHLKSGSLPSNGAGLCTARQLQCFMRFRGMGTVQQLIVERMLELATPSHAPGVTRRGGRPTLPRGARRSRVLRVRLREEEYEQVKRRADGGSVSASARAMLLAAMRSTE